MNSSNMPALLPEGTGVKYAVHPADTGRIAYIDGLWDGHTVPQENEVITRPFLVDPTTRTPVPVRVVQIQRRVNQEPPILVVVVAREQ